MNIMCSSCLNIWEWAENNNVPKLASKAKGVALTYFQVLRHTEDFLHIPIERLTVMLDHELLKYRYEDEILESILDWVEYARADRQQHLKELLPFVCFPFLATRYLNELRKNDLIGLRSEYGSYLDEALTYHLASLQTGGKAIQKEILQRQILSLKRLMLGMRMVVVLIGETVVHEEPLTNVVACYMDMAHPHSRFREILQFSIASLPLSVGLRFASATWNHDIYVCGGYRKDMILVVWEGESLMRLYPYNYKDPLKEQVGRFLHYGLTQLLDQSQLLDLKVMVGGQMFRCHGLVMACISDFFKSELAELRRCPRKRQKGEKRQEEEEEEEEETTIVLDDSCVTPHIFQLLLDMIYQRALTCCRTPI
ncbi:hypothetical protein ACOMHN_064658 [Nucella lapillus]